MRTAMQNANLIASKEQSLFTEIVREYKQGMTKMVTEQEAELLAKKHIEAYMNECKLSTVRDAELAIQKLLAMVDSAFAQIHGGSPEVVQ